MGNHECPFTCCLTGTPCRQKSPDCSSPLSLEKVVECYKKHKKESLGLYLQLFEPSSDELNKLECAVNSTCPVCGKPHSHQYRWASRLEKLWSYKRKNFQKVTDVHSNSMSFEELYDGVKAIITSPLESQSQNNTQYKPFKEAPLICYDIALRISVIRGVLPEEQVYLHSGALKGYKILKEKGLLNFEPLKGNGSKRVPKKYFLPQLQTLTAYEIEDFLCHCHECFEYVPANKGTQ